MSDDLERLGNEMALYGGAMLMVLAAFLDDMSAENERNYRLLGHGFKEAVNRWNEVTDDEGLADLLNRDALLKKLCVQALT